MRRENSLKPQIWEMVYARILFFTFLNMNEIKLPKGQKLQFPPENHFLEQNQKENKNILIHVNL
jgi:hypothetical protein